jgi:hypothetical protein
MKELMLLFMRDKMKQNNKMKELKKVIILIAIVVLIPFVMSYDFDGDGVDDGEQNLCGDGFCQEWETEVICPADCIGTSPGKSTDVFEENQNRITNQPKFGEKKVTELLSDSLNPKLILGISVPILLIILGLIVYFLIKRKNKTVQSTEVPASN